MNINHYPLFLSIYTLLAMFAIEKATLLKKFYEDGGVGAVNWYDSLLFYIIILGSVIAMFWTLGLLAKDADQEKWYSEDNIVFILIIAIQGFIIIKLGYFI